MTKDEALKMALETLDADPLEMVADVDGHMVFLKDKAITAIKEALAQPEQEPVAWISTGPARMIHWTADKPAYGDDWVPLYITPPQRKPLTDEQIIASNYPDGEENGPTIAAPDFELICFARQIEAAHNILEQGDKNEDSSNNALLQRTLGDADQLHDQCESADLQECASLYGGRRVC